MIKNPFKSLKSMFQVMSVTSQITLLVIALHALVIVGVPLNPDRSTSANSMGDLVVASLLDPNPHLENKKKPTPKVEKKVAPLKQEPKPVVQNAKSMTTTTAPLPVESSNTTPASSAGGSSAGELKSVSISQAQCSVPEPFYPSLSRRMGEEGKTMVRLFINESGAVEKVALSQSSGIQRLDQAALDAAMKVRCRPFVEFGKAIKVTAIQPYIFRLE